MISKFTAVLGLGIIALAVTAVSHGFLPSGEHHLSTAAAERSALLACLPEATKLQLSDDAIHNNVALYRKTIEIAKVTSDNAERQRQIESWARSDFLKQIDSLPKAVQGETFGLLKMLRADDNAGYCLVGKVQTLS